MIRTNPTLLRTGIGLCLAAVAVPVGVAFAHGNHHDHLTSAQRAVVREATARYRNVDAAIADGYIPTDECVELPDGSAGMGYHYVNPELASDRNIDPTMPEILVYVPARGNELKLGAVEYFLADADQDLTTDDDRPTLMGHPFDGPMAGHDATMPAHYDLHVWLYHRNPDGELAAWNPRVDCP